MQEKQVVRKQLNVGCIIFSYGEGIDSSFVLEVFSFEFVLVHSFFCGGGGVEFNLPRYLFQRGGHQLFYPLKILMVVGSDF